MDVKSPDVQPMRHRVVLTDARCHTDLELQNRVENMEGGGDGGLVVAFAAEVLLQHDVFVACCL